MIKEQEDVKDMIADYKVFYTIWEGVLLKRIFMAALRHEYTYLTPIKRPFYSIDPCQRRFSMVLVIV